MLFMERRLQVIDATTRIVATYSERCVQYIIEGSLARQIAVVPCIVFLSFIEEMC